MNHNADGSPRGKTASISAKIPSKALSNSLGDENLALLFINVTSGAPAIGCSKDFETLHYGLESMILLVAWDRHICSSLLY